MAMSADASTKRLMRINGPTLILAALFAVLGSPASPQSAEEASALMPPLGWRSIGPDRGGRSIAVAGHSGRPFEYYFGATGGGLFKTTDGGSSWLSGNRWSDRERLSRCSDDRRVGSGHRLYWDGRSSAPR